MNRLTFALVCLLSFEPITVCLGQDFGCPLEDGVILPPNSGLYSHADPTHGITVLSFKQDDVLASLKGRVLDVIKSPEGLYFVVIRTGDITIAYKYMQLATVTKDQNVEFGYPLGNAQKSDSAGYSIDVAIWYVKESVNASELLPCKTRKFPSKTD